VAPLGLAMECWEKVGFLRVFSSLFYIYKAPGKLGAGSNCLRGTFDALSRLVFFIFFMCVFHVRLL